MLAWPSPRIPSQWGACLFRPCAGAQTQKVGLFVGKAPGVAKAAAPRFARAPVPAKNCSPPTFTCAFATSLFPPPRFHVVTSQSAHTAAIAKSTMSRKRAFAATSHTSDDMLVDAGDGFGAPRSQVRFRRTPPSTANKQLTQTADTFLAPDFTVTAPHSGPVAAHLQPEPTVRVLQPRRGLVLHHHPQVRPDRCDSKHTRPSVQPRSAFPSPAAHPRRVSHTPGWSPQEATH